MLYLLVTLILFIFLALIISAVFSLLSPASHSEESIAWRVCIKLALKNLLFIVGTVFVLGLMATIIGLIF